MRITFYIVGIRHNLTDHNQWFTCLWGQEASCC